MKVILGVFLSCFFVSRLSICSAQQKPIVFTNVSVENITNIGLITGMIQDKKGYIWFATSIGLHRYDGYHDVVYMHDPSNSNSIASNSLECIYADKEGNIWIGTQTAGLDKFDPETGIFKHFRYSKKDSTSISSDIITAIMEDDLGFIWVGTASAGVCKLDVNTGKFARFFYNWKDAESLSNDHVRVIYEDREHSIWIGTGTPWYVKEEGGLNRFDREKNKFKRYLHDAKDQHSLIDNRVRAIFEDSHGNFWVGSADDGLHTMDRAKGTFTRHTYDSGNPEKLSRPALKARYQDGDDHITFITEDIAGFIWIGTYRNGINRYDPSTNKVIHIGDESDSTSGFKNENGWWAFNSNDGLLWISTWNLKLFTFNPYQNIIPHASCEYPVNNVKSDSSGNIWLGTGHGVYFKNYKTGILSHYFNRQNDLGSLCSNVVTTIYIGKQSDVWIGTNRGISRLVANKSLFKNYIPEIKDPNDLPENTISVLCNKDKENLWVGSQAGLGLMNIETGVWTAVWNRQVLTHDLVDDWVACFHQEGDGLLWFGCINDGGLQLLKIKENIIKHYLDRLSVNCIYTDAYGIMWAGTRSGLFRYDPPADRYVAFNLKNIGTESIFINDISEDKQANLWLATSKGIVRINSARNDVSFFGKNQGVNPDHFNAGGYLMSGGKTPNGELLFPDNTGYYHFFPEQFANKSIAPQIVLANFKLGETSLVPNNNGPLYRTLNKTSQINLNYDENSFEIEFAALHFSNPENNYQIFELENSDHSWRKGKGEQTAYYNNLPPGNYIFHIKAYNEDGVWSEKNLIIIIGPPWWKTWWAYSLFVLTAAASLYWIYRIRIKQLWAKQQERLHTMVATQEEERKRISRDLHDDVGTKLSALKLYISSLKNNIHKKQYEEAHALSANAEELINETMRDVREMLLNLSPNVLEEFGYTTAVEGLVNKINTAKLINFKLVLFGMEKRLPKDYELALYRITQELINNILKHAEAKNVSLQIGYRDNKIVLMIEDDGKGFDIAMHKEGYGLKNLEARTTLLHGIMHIDSTLGKGTSILIEIPFQFRNNAIV